MKDSHIGGIVVCVALGVATVAVFQEHSAPLRIGACDMTPRPQAFYALRSCYGRDDNDISHFFDLGTGCFINQMTGAADYCPTFVSHSVDHATVWGFE